MDKHTQRERRDYAETNYVRQRGAMILGPGRLLLLMVLCAIIGALVCNLLTLSQGVQP